MSKVGFDKWMKKVDAKVFDLISCSVYDLADCNFRDWFEDGVSPAEAADRAIREDDTGFDELLDEFGEDELEFDY